VARRRPPRAMRPHPAVRIARVTVPAALVTQLAGVAGAVAPADDAPVSYPAALGPKPDTIRIYRAVCHHSPLVKTFCCRCASAGDHAERRALDCMISDSTAGWDIAKWIAIVKSLGGVAEITIGSTSGNEVQMAGVRCHRCSPTAKSDEPRTHRGLRRQRHCLVEESKQP
jgi:hypothetical protein